MTTGLPLLQRILSSSASALLEKDAGPALGPVESKCHPGLRPAGRGGLARGGPRLQGHGGTHAAAPHPPDGKAALPHRGYRAAQRRGQGGGVGGAPCRSSWGDGPGGLRTPSRGHGAQGRGSGNTVPRQHLRSHRGGCGSGGTGRSHPRGVHPEREDERLTPGPTEWCRTPEKGPRGALFFIDKEPKRR